jgi:hypothetical protein
MFGRKVNLPLWYLRAVARIAMWKVLALLISHPHHLGLVTSVNASHINGLRRTILGECIRSWHSSTGSLEQSGAGAWTSRFFLGGLTECSTACPGRVKTYPPCLGPGESEHDPWAYSDAVVQINYCSLCAVNA